jgi:MarR family
MRSFDAVKLVLDKAPKDLTPVQRLVLIQIAHKQPKCFATVKELGREIGISQEKTVSKAIKVLESKQLITVTRRAYSSSWYVLDSGFVQGREIPDVVRHEIPAVVRHATPVKQTYNKQYNKQDFERFWSLYPRKESRVKAEQAFSMLTPNLSIDALLSATQTYRDSVAGRELKFVKLACNWLEQECWLDQVEVESVDDWMSRANND